MNSRLSEFIAAVQFGQKVSFNETIATISAFYDYVPTEFSNGAPKQSLNNSAGENESSCKIFYFAKLHQLSQQQTLTLFGDYYWKDVIEHSDDINHQNIKHFMQYGWQGIEFKGIALTLKI